LRRRFEVTLGLSDLFLHSTATRLAAVVLGRSAAAVKDHSGRVIPRSLESRRYALTKAQQGMWMQSQQNPDEPLYNESEAVLLRGVLDAGMLRASLQGVMDRHEVLRSTISLEEFGPVATVQNGTTLEYRLFDLREKADALGEMLVEEAKRPFDLEEGPGFRAALFCLGEREHVLLLMMHHVVTDRFSFGVVWREVAASYCAARRGERAALPDLLVQYGDYALWRRRETGTLALQAMKEFWLQQLDGAPRTVRWPGREGRTVSGSFVGAHHRTAIPPASADRIREASRRQAASLFSIFATAFSTLLHRACAQDEIVLGIPVADREAPELQPLVGYLVDMHAVRVDHRGSPTFPELLRRVRARLAEAIAHSSVSFVEVFEAMELVSDPVRPPIVQVALNWRDRNAQLEFIGLEGLEVEPVYLDTGMAKFELGLVMTDTGAGGEIRLEWEYRKEWFDAGQIDLLAEEFASVLEEAANGL
jgi:hypothetical protein